MLYCSLDHYSDEDVILVIFRQFGGQNYDASDSVIENKIKSLAELRSVKTYSGRYPDLEPTNSYSFS